MGADGRTNERTAAAAAAQSGKRGKYLFSAWSIIANESIRDNSVRPGNGANKKTDEGRKGRRLIHEDEGETEFEVQHFEKIAKFFRFDGHARTRVALGFVILFLDFSIDAPLRLNFHETDFYVVLIHFLARCPVGTDSTGVTLTLNVR